MCQHCDKMTPAQRMHALTMRVRKARRQFRVALFFVSLFAHLTAPFDWIVVALGGRKAHSGIKGNTLATWSVDWYVDCLRETMRESTRNTLRELGWPAHLIAHVLDEQPPSTPPQLP